MSLEKERRGQEMGRKDGGRRKGGTGEIEEKKRRE